MKFTPVYLRLLSVLGVFVTLSLYVHAGRAQDPAQSLNAPPPPKIISKEDQVRIDSADDSKSRIRVTIELSESHLTKAESLTSQHEYDGATAELGRYAALIEDALGFLAPLSRDRNKTRDLYKRLELALRAHGPRLTAIRRITPLEYAIWIKGLEDFARKGRTEALNSFYGHTVFRERPADDKAGKTPKDNKPVAERKPQ